MGRFYECDVCGDAFENFDLLALHLSTQHTAKVANRQEGLYECLACLRCFKIIGNYAAHLKYECRVEPTFECAFCGGKFHFKAYLNEHLLLKHCEVSVSMTVPPAEESVSSPATFKCSLCPRQFARHASLNYHMSRKHANRTVSQERDPLVYPFECSNCGSRYKNANQLARHTTWECGKEPMFQCTECVRKFHHRQTLREHIKRHVAKTLKEPSSHDYFCEKCGKGYKLRSSLLNHKNWECGKGPLFNCKECSLKFNHKGNLKKHVLAKHVK